MKKFNRFVMKSVSSILIFGSAVGVSLAEDSHLSPPSKNTIEFSCRSVEGDHFLEIVGEFSDLDKTKFFGRKGSFAIYDSRDGKLQLFNDVEFLRGMWELDRMNLYIRNAQGEVTLGLMVDNFFKGTSYSSSGFFYGDIDTKLTCRSTCNHCSESPFLSEVCKKECGCLTSFCGGW